VTDGQDIVLDQSAGGAEPVAGTLPRIIRFCGYRCRRSGRWRGYCLEFHLEATGRDWEDLLERMILAASMRVAQIQERPELAPTRKAPLRIRLTYMYIALLHFLRPQGERCLADLSARLLTSPSIK
jgi:hypothetical protein